MAKSGAKLLTISRDINPCSLVSEFLEVKKAQGVTAFTIRSSKSALNNFFAEYKGSITDGKKLKHAVCLFLADKTNEYYNKPLQALRQFFEYCIGENVLRTNPCDGLRYKKHTNRIVEHSEETIKAMLQLSDRSTFAGLRDYVFIMVMLDTGIRPNELLQIRISPQDNIVSNDDLFIPTCVICALAGKSLRDYRYS